MTTKDNRNHHSDAASADKSAEGLRRDFGLLAPEDLAALIGVDVRTLALWRAQKRGPDVAKLGRAVFYRRSDVNAWIALNVAPSDRVT